MLMFVGRLAETQNLGLRRAAVDVDDSGFVIGGYGGDSERTSVSHIYAIGDVLQVSHVHLQCQPSLFTPACSQDVYNLPVTFYLTVIFLYIYPVEMSKKNVKMVLLYSKIALS